MFDVLLTGPFVPFTFALALLTGLLLLELILLLIGGTLLGMGADADLDADFDVDAPDLGDLDIDFGDADPDAFDAFDPDVDAPETASGSGMAGPASWLGIGKVPTLIWIASILLGFGVSGLVLQSFVAGLLGGPLPALLAVLPAAFVGAWFAGTFGTAFARLLPRTESTAMSARHLGRRTGTVTQGTARRGSPAEVRVRDRHGNTHYLRAEPLNDEEEIPQGTEVLVLRHRYDTGYRLVALGDLT